MHPSSEVIKRYHVTLKEPYPATRLSRLVRGLTFEGERLKVERAALINPKADGGAFDLRDAECHGLRPVAADAVRLGHQHYDADAYKNRKIYIVGGGKQWRPLIHVRDVARAFLAVIEAPREKVAGEAFNVGSSEQNFQVFQVAQMVRDVVPNTEVIVIPDDPDKRTYNVDFSKIKRVLGFQTATSPYEGIVEIKQALERGLVDDTVQTRTVEYYRYLLEAQKVLNEVCLDGKVF